MATLWETCKCGGKLQIGVSQYGRDERLRWSESVSCSGCSERYEADGSGLAGEKARAAIMAEAGQWVLAATDGASRARIVVRLRELLGFGLREASSLMALMPGDIVHGTPVEMQWLSRQVNAKCGNVTSVRPGTGGLSIAEIGVLIR